MLYVIQHGYNGVSRRSPHEIVYCMVRIEDIINDGIDCIFTDGHALNSMTKVYSRHLLPQLNRIVNYNDVYAVRWNLESDVDLKRRKEQMFSPDLLAMAVRHIRRSGI